MSVAEPQANQFNRYERQHVSGAADASAVVVEMVRIETPRDIFSLSLTSWNLMLELGRVFGWQAQGTTYVLPAKSKRKALVHHDYRPGDVRDHKKISAEDASNWARSLETARASPHFAGMMAARPESEQEKAIRSQLGKFIEYAYGGAFAFAAREQLYDSTR